MTAHFFRNLNLFAVLPMLALILLAPSRALSQERFTRDFADIETRIRFFARFHTPDHVPATTLSLLAASVLPFRQHLGARTDKQQVSIVQPIWGGLLGATVGFFGGAFVGSAASGQRGYDAVGTAIAGAIIGEALVLPMGVHYGNRKQGNLVLDVLTSFVVVGAGLLVSDDLDVVLFIPVVQIAATVAVERATARRR